MQIIIIGIAILSVLLILCKKFHICQLGFHDKENVNCLNCNKFITSEMNKYPDHFHQGNFENAQRLIFTDMYGDDRSYLFHCNNKLVYDKVCIKCHKCFNKIEFEKMHIEFGVENMVKEIDADRIRKKIASDIYKENCKKT